MQIDLDTATIKMAFVTLQVGGTPTISKTTPGPTWGAGGTTNLATNEVTPCGGFTAGGVALTSGTWINTAGTCAFDSALASWTSSASGDPATIKTAVVYSDTATNKDCIGFIDMTADGTTAISLLTGDVSVTPNATGWFTVTNPQLGY